MTKTKLLIMDDRPHQQKLLRDLLGHSPDGFEVFTHSSALEGLDWVRSHQPQVILLNPAMPVINGFDLCRLIKKDERTRKAVIVFVAHQKPSPSDIAHAFGQGADDFISTPLAADELLARIRARLKKPEPLSTDPIQLGSLTLVPISREAQFHGKKAKLTGTEFNILKCLAENPNTVISRDEILKSVWKENSGSVTSRTIDVHIRAIRRKIPPISKWITSTYGVGYKFAEPAQTQ